MVNVRSLFKKTDELQSTLTTNNIDLACVTETWLAEYAPTEAINLSGCICYRHDREHGRRGGDVLCYVRENVPCTVLHH